MSSLITLSEYTQGPSEVHRRLFDSHPKGKHIVAKQVNLATFNGILTQRDLEL